MAEAEWYRELARDAQDALEKLLTHTKPGTGIYLHQALERLRIENERADREAATATTRTDDVDVAKLEAEDARKTADRHWRMLERHARNRVFIEAIGDDRLTVQEVAARLPNHLPEWGNARPWYYHHVYPHLVKMIAAGELDRAHAEIVKGRPVWRYFRRVDLEGPIADLARQFEGESAS